MNVSELSEKYTLVQEQNEQLKTQLMSNSLIYELTKVMHSCTDQDGIIKTVLLGIQEIINFPRAVLFSIDKENFVLRPKLWVGLKDADIKDFAIPLGFEGGEITDSIFLNRHLIIEHPDEADDPFAKKLGSPSYLVIPLINKATRKCWEVKNCNKMTCPVHGGYNPFCWSIPNSGQMLGAASENEKRKGCIACACFKVEGVFWMDRAGMDLPIASDDITTLSLVINQAGIILENFRIFNALEKVNGDLKNANTQLTTVNHDLQVAQAKINTDLEHARIIQQGLLPQGILSAPGFSASARYIPADAVGGDYYDVFEIAKGVYGIVVADVSGHGISSALIMSMVKVLLKIHATVERSPQKTLETINRTFLSEIRTDNFVTIFYALLDTNAHVISYASAGHCPVLLLNKETKQCAQIKADGLFLGIFPDMMLKETRYSYMPGAERIVLYTDGLTEARNKDDDMFEVEKLTESAIQTLSFDTAQTVDKILARQKSFCGSQQIPEDDITLLVLDL